MLHAGHADDRLAALPRQGDGVLGHGPPLPVAAAGGDDEVVGDLRSAAQVQNRHVLGAVVSGLAGQLNGQPAGAILLRPARSRLGQREVSATGLWT